MFSLEIFSIINTVWLSLPVHFHLLRRKLGSKGLSGIMMMFTEIIKLSDTFQQTSLEGKMKIICKYLNNTCMSSAEQRYQYSAAVAIS